jgi:hypothetical protein
MLAEALSASKSPSTPAPIAPAPPAMLAPTTAQLAAVTQLLPVAARLNICR